MIRARYCTPTSGYQLREATLQARVARAGRTLRRNAPMLAAAARDASVHALRCALAYRPAAVRAVLRWFALREVRELQGHRRAVVRALADNEAVRRQLETHLRQIDGAITLNEEQVVRHSFNP